ncbi:HEPN domain-containing protein [Candidatus Pacearchaeota archaeon]|nr:HEPN domain-containing protein [Candidatus Pacearchaeota archaeon]
MDEKRIKQAESNFRMYLNEGKIKKIDKFDNIIYETYLRNAKESLQVANQLFENKTSSLWVVVSGYYSMFYMACAFLYKLGYKSGGEIVHQVVNESLIAQGRHKIKNHLLENYNEEKEKALVIVDSYLNDYEREKAKRSSFQYQTTEEIKESKAKTSLNRAKEFVELIREVLQK